MTNKTKSHQTTLDRFADAKKTDKMKKEEWKSHNEKSTIKLFQLKCVTKAENQLSASYRTAIAP